MKVIDILDVVLKLSSLPRLTADSYVSSEDFENDVKYIIAGIDMGVP